jgi:hypothetical protein
MQLWDLHSGCNTVCDSRALPYVCGCHTTSSDRSTCLGSTQFPARSRWQLDQVQCPILFPQIKLLSCEFPVIIKGFGGPDQSCEDLLFGVAVFFQPLRNVKVSVIGN